MKKLSNETVKNILGVLLWITALLILSHWSGSVTKEEYENLKVEYAYLEENYDSLVLSYEMFNVDYSALQEEFADYQHWRSDAEGKIFSLQDSYEMLFSMLEEPNMYNVYIEDNGYKYHWDNCPLLDGCIETDLQDAIARGYSLCSTCF